MSEPRTIENCAFCRIVRGETAAQRLYEDERVLAFLDIGPINPGHTLLIPREHHNSLTTVPAETLAQMMQLAPLMAQALVRETNADAFNLHLANGVAAGQTVNHVHLHIIPRSTTDGFAWGWRSGELPDETACRRLLDNVQKRLS